MIKNITILTILFFLASYCLKAQNIDENTLWLKGATSLENKNTIDSLNQYIFNYNSTIDINKKKPVFKNILDEYFSIFVVFKSSKEPNQSIFKLKTRKYNIEITGEHADKDRALEFDKASTKDGVILSYISKMKNYSKRNSLSFEDFYKHIKEDPKNNQLMEVLYFPKILNQIEIQKIESYLSLKHGISLIGNKTYISSQRDTIWSYKDNKIFNHRVTGIGRDDSHHLNQKQSHNASKDGISIGLTAIDSTNQLNKTKIDNDTFITWGDTNQTTVLQQKENEAISKMNRVWKIQGVTKNETKEFIAEIQLDSKLMNIKSSQKALTADEENIIWLAINESYSKSFDYDSATKYPQSKDEDSIISFKNISFQIVNDLNSYFTFFAAPRFFVSNKITPPLCETPQLSQVTITMNGGQAPFQIDVNSSEEARVFNTSEKNYNLDLSAGSHTITVTDTNNQQYNFNIDIDKTILPEILLAKKWQLNLENEVHIIPRIQGDENNELLYAWYNQETLFSNNHQVIIRNVGNYKLVTTTPNGCISEYPFTVSKPPENTIEQGVLFPNPADTYTPFTLQLLLDAPSKVTIQISNAIGQLVHTEELAKTKMISYKHQMNSSGTYYVSVEANGNTKTYKLLVK